MLHSPIIWNRARVEPQDGLDWRVLFISKLAAYRSFVQINCRCRQELQAGDNKCERIREHALVYEV